MTGGNIYVIPSEHKFTSGCTTLEKTYFHISVTSVERYDLLSRLDRLHTIHCGDELISEVERCFCSDDYSDMVRLRAILFDTVAELMKYISIPVVYYSPLVEKVISYINNNLSAKLSVSEIASLFFVSESKLRNSFKEETGMPIGKYIDDMIFIKAKQMLTKDDTSIADISAKLGFCDRFYFSRKFASFYGISPKRFAKPTRT
jgi:two-component system response regulator YesN